MVALAWITAATSPSLAQPFGCEGTEITVIAEDAAHAALVCTAAHRTADQFALCGVPPISRPIQVEIVEQIEARCLGLYHCGENLIEVLSPPALQHRRDPDGVLAHLDIDTYFQSIVIHELAHAATDGMPCPFADCLVGTEYVAHVMQAMSLDEQGLAEFESSFEMGEPVPNDMLNPFSLQLAPDLFAQMSWAHFVQQDDPCGYVRQIVAGEVVMDSELFLLE